jgi:hypothetical protein
MKLYIYSRSYSFVGRYLHILIVNFNDNNINLIYTHQHAALFSIPQPFHTSSCSNHRRQWFRLEHLPCEHRLFFSPFPPAYICSHKVGISPVAPSIVTLRPTLREHALQRLFHSFRSSDSHWVPKPREYLRTLNTSRRLQLQEKLDSIDCKPAGSIIRERTDLTNIPTEKTISKPHRSTVFPHPAERVHGSFRTESPRYSF